MRAEAWRVRPVGPMGRTVRIGRVLGAVTTTLRALVDRDVERLPVVDGGWLVGLLERADIERWIEASAAADVSAEAA